MVPRYNPDGTQHQDWDNYVWFTNQSPSFRYFCRGSSPNSAQGVITVGNLSSYANFRRATSSNYGPNIDVFAPGSEIVSCFGKPGVIEDADGNKLFTLADKETLMNKADVEVLSNVASEILGSITSDEAKEK